MAKQMRSKGEGCIYLRKDGRWSAMITVTQSDGTRKRKCITKRDKAEVLRLLRETIHQQSQNIPFSEKNWTMAEYLDYWLWDIQPDRVT